jgi:WD domain, G-beta repeat
MRLPDLVAYQSAVQHPETAFGDADLRAATVSTTRLGLPRVAAGNFALTYQLCQGGRRWAVRCFHRDAADRAKRYAAISKTLASLRGGPLVTITYIPLGVHVDQSWFPITKMPWLDGRPFNRAVEANLGSPSALADLERRFLTLVGELRRLGLAHGDIQHGNLLVEQSGALKLVDYDGMFVPDLRGMLASESGDPNYQHPGRTLQFDAQLDRFAALVIVVALRALAQLPSLWRTYNTDDNLLFRRTDFVSPDASALFRDLRACAATRDLAERLARVCQSDYALVPAVEDFLHDKIRPRPSIGTRPAAAASPRAGGAPGQLTTTLRIGDVLTLNRLYSPRKTRPTRRSWSLRRAAAQAALAFTPDGRLLATAEATRKVRLRETRSGRVLHVWSNPSQITLMACSPDGRRVFGSGPDGTLSMWPLTARGVAQHLVTPPGTVRGLVAGPSGPLVAVAAGQTISLLEPTSHARLSFNVGRVDVTCVGFAGDASLLASGGADGSWRCWSTGGGGLLAANRQRGRVSCLAVSADGRTFASGSADGILRVWAVPGGNLVTEVHLPGAEAILRITFAGDGARLAAAGASGRIVIWDLLREEVVHSLSGPPGVPSDLQFSPDGRTLGVTSLSGAVWLRALPSLPTSLRLPSGRQVGRVTAPGLPAGHWLIDVLRKVGAAAWAP